MKITSKPLPVPMNDSRIKSEFQPGTFTEKEIETVLNNPVHDICRNGMSNIFYLKDKVCFAFFQNGYWYKEILNHSDLSEWGAGRFIVIKE